MMNDQIELDVQSITERKEEKESFCELEEVAVGASEGQVYDCQDYHEQQKPENQKMEELVQPPNEDIDITYEDGELMYPNERQLPPTEVIVIQIENVDCEVDPRNIEQLPTEVTPEVDLYPFGEEEIKDIRIEGELPWGVSNYFLQFIYAIVYPLIGFYYVFKHELWRFVLYEIIIASSVYFLLHIATISITITCLLIFGQFELLIPAIVIVYEITKYFYELIAIFFLLKAIKRISRIEEHRMKGNYINFEYVQYFPEEEITLNCVLSSFYNVLAYLVRVLTRQFIFIILLPTIAFCICSMIPLGSVNLVIYSICCGYYMCMNMGCSCFDLGLFDRKYGTEYCNGFVWAIRNQHIIFGFGIGCLLFHTCPVLDLVLLLFYTIGATRIYCHVEDSKR